jgi:hypothetical protein
MHHNGQLRIVFHELAAPEGMAQRVNAVPVGVAAAKAEHLELDAEGGAEATSPDTRYFHTVLEVGAAAASSGLLGDSVGADRSAGGAGGFKLVGIVIGAVVHSQPLGIAMGAFGAGRSIYRNFLSQGHEVIFPKNTAMAVSVGGNPDREPGCSVPEKDATPAQVEKAGSCALLHARIL